jgi:hypothetical protein
MAFGTKEHGMTARIRDFTTDLAAAIVESRAVASCASVRALEEASAAVYITSSEYLGAVGFAIVEFLRTNEADMPASARQKLRGCLHEIQKVWPSLKA